MRRRKRSYPGLREKAGKWEYRFMVSGVRYTEITDLEATAENAGAVLRLKDEHRHRVIVGTPIQQRVQFSEAAERFLGWSRQAHRDHPNTWKRQRTSLASLKAMMGQHFMDSITAGQIDDFVEWRRESGIREVTIRHDLHALSQLLQYAERQGWTESNPVRLVDMPSDRASRNEHVLSDADERAYFAAARKHPVVHDVGRLIILQGMRPDEVLSLQKENIDLDARTLEVKSSKTSAGKRTLNLTGESCAILGRRMRWASPLVFPGAVSARKLDTVGDYEVVAGRRGQVYAHERHYSYSAYIGAHNRICRLCGVSFDPYSLRHTFATRFYTQTKDIFSLQRVLGHADLKTLQRYVHVDEEHVRAAMRQYEASLRPIVEVVQ